MADFPLPDFVQSIHLKKIAGAAKPFVLVDSNTAKHCLSEIALPADAVVIEIKAGEEHKNIHTCMQVWEQLTKHHADRNAILINIGGGVVCDIGGFVASSYKRGINFAQVPTSLLAMADAAIGGKTGIDFLGYKNQIGTFAQPHSITIYPSFLETLPERELLSGMAEVLKHYIIADETSFNEFVLDGIPNTENYNAWKTILQKAIAIKTSIAANDPFEKGARKKLNFGHTVGHALESYFLNTNKPLLHGEAVAIGMVCELLIASELKIMASPEAEKVIQVLQEVFLPQQKIEDENAVLQLMKQDKKNQGDKILFSLPNRIGHCLYNCEVEEDVVKNAIRSFNAKLI
jgi:3-dehydroquinate synthase